MERWTVLVVDDEPGIRTTLRNYLMISDYDVVTAADGQEALEIVRRQKVHVVLLDIKMPGMSGLDVLSEIRQYDFSIQVIMVTGYSTFDSTIVALERGAADYILKPFEEMEHVVKMVRLSTERLQRWREALYGSSGARPGE